MEAAVAVTVTPETSPEINLWRPTKRIPDDDAAHEDDGSLPDHSSLSSLGALTSDISFKHAKRFKQNPIKSANDLPPNVGRLPQRGTQIAMENTLGSVLSPITEIALNLSDTTLNSPTAHNKDSWARKKHCVIEGGNNDETPVKGWDRNTTSIKRKLTAFQDGENTHQDQPYGCEQYSADTNSTHTEGFHNAATRTAPAGRGSRRLNMETSLSEIAIDELSFYDDDSAAVQHHQRSFTASPQLMGLLSPEGSPQRFQVIEKPATKFLPPSARQQRKAPNTTVTVLGDRSSNGSAPAKNLRMFHSLSSGSMESSIDDEYMELFEMESLEQQISQSSLNFPSDLNSLISGQIKSASPASAAGFALIKTPEMRRPSVRRCLSMTENQQQQQHLPKTPEFLKKVQEAALSSSGALTPNCCFKRPDPPSTTCSPIQSKRYRGEEKENLDGSFSILSATTTVTGSTSTTVSATATTTLSAQITRPVFRKCISMNDAEIMTALARSESKDQPDLIGDFSKPFALPLMEGRHRDLKSISSETVARLLQGEFDEQVASYSIIDCRYPYEFEGGHIRGAKNMYTQEQIMEEFLTQQKTEQHQARSEAAGGKRNIIIFHCEFSSERGPKLSRFLRNNDRARNTNAYPALDYPEIYLLHNGYKEFYETHAELCDPTAYRPMLEPSYNEAYRHFRAKSKSWNGDGLGGATSRLKKSRSRLLL